MYKVDKGLEYPLTRTKYPFGDMEVGDSILFPDRPEADKARVSGMRYIKAHGLGWKFSLRTVENGYRLWRVK